MSQQHRHLAAILFTDIVGSTAIMQKDEEKALAINKRYVAVLKECVLFHSGEILNDFGDGSLCVFSSAKNAVVCAISLQVEFEKDPKVPLRIGIHAGEIFFEDGKALGNAVNVASRVQSLGIARSILFSTEIKNEIKNLQEFKSVSLGRFHFKNVDEPMEIFAVTNSPLLIPKREQMQGKLKKTISHKKILFISIAFVVALTLFFMFRRYMADKLISNEEKSIAIIPFKVSGNSEDVLSDGLVEDILARLMKIKDLKVISNRSSVLYADQKKSPKEIGEELNVNTLMMGSIQRIGERIKVNAQLIDSRTGDIIWTDVYDRDKFQVFDLETELATQIVNSLKAKLTPREKSDLSKKYTDNVEAYKFYRRGRFFWDQRTITSYDSAEVNYKRAIELDPDYALAYSGLADCYTLPFRGISQLEGVPIARAYATKALSLDSSLAEALTTIGFIESAFDYNWAKSKITLQKSIALNPNYSTAHVYYGNLLQYTHENTEEGINEIKRALQLDPLSASINWVMGRNYCFAHKFDSAYNQLKKTVAIFPNYSHAKETFVYVLLQKHDHIAAIEWSRKITGMRGGLTLSYSYAIKGDTISAKKELEKTLKNYTDVSPYGLAAVYTALKEYNIALVTLEHAYECRDIDMYFINADPIFDEIRTQPAFVALLKKMNLDQSWFHLQN